MQPMNRPPSPNQFIDYLCQFNRKERFHLIGKALGNPTFRLSSEFVADLQAVLKEAPPIPQDSFAAMDYHIDWLFACIVCSSKNGANLLVPGRTGMYQRDPTCITGKIQDFDMIIAYPDVQNPAISHLILLEAKGASDWKQDQLTQKACRLMAIFGDDGLKWADVVQPYFVAASPRRPCVSVSNFPKFMAPDGQFRWLRLDVPAGLKVTRCDEFGRNNRDGTCWRPDVG